MLDYYAERSVLVKLIEPREPNGTHGGVRGSFSQRRYQKKWYFFLKKLPLGKERSVRKWHQVKWNWNDIFGRNG